MEHWVNIGIGTAACFSAGLIASLSGGAGLIAIPTLIFLGLPSLSALGTNKLIASCSNTTSALMLKGEINVRKFLPLGIMMSVFSVLGSLFIGELIPQDKIKPIIAILLMGLAVKNLFHIRIPTPNIRQNKWALRGVSAIMGIYSGAIGLGVGPLYLIIGKSVFRLNNLEASSFAKLMCLFVNVPSLLTFALVLKNVNYIYGIPMALASILGTYIGTRFFNKLSDKVLNTVMFVTVFIIGLIMLLRP